MNNICATWVTDTLDYIDKSDMPERTKCILREIVKGKLTSAQLVDLMIQSMSGRPEGQP